MNNPIYNVDYFIKKFEAIPEDLWCVGSQLNYRGQRCAYGHCTIYSGAGNHTVEGTALTRLMSSLPMLLPVFDADFEPYLSTPARINNGDVQQYQQPTPKQRVLAALYDIKKAQRPEVTERIVYVTVDEPVRELQKQELALN